MLVEKMTHLGYVALSNVRVAWHRRRCSGRSNGVGSLRRDRRCVRRNSALRSRVRWLCCRWGHRVSRGRGLRLHRDREQQRERQNQRSQCMKELPRCIAIFIHKTSCEIFPLTWRKQPPCQGRLFYRNRGGIKGLRGCCLGARKILHSKFDTVASVIVVRDST